eukprot:6172668-Pleurochrysis_carterae.AAC.2
MGEGRRKHSDCVRIRTLKAKARACANAWALVQLRVRASAHVRGCECRLCRHRCAREAPRLLHGDVRLRRPAERAQLNVELQECNVHIRRSD